MLLLLLLLQMISDWRLVGSNDSTVSAVVSVDVLLHSKLFNNNKSLCNCVTTSCCVGSCTTNATNVVIRNESVQFVVHCSTNVVQLVHLLYKQLQYQCNCYTNRKTTFSLCKNKGTKATLKQLIISSLLRFWNLSFMNHNQFVRTPLFVSIIPHLASTSMIFEIALMNVQIVLLILQIAARCMEGTLCQYELYHKQSFY